MACPEITLVTGGSRSGKTAYALRLALPFQQRVYVATAEPLDREMEDRIARHRIERAERFTTLEEPLDLAGALSRVPPDAGVALIDCLTVWLGNLMHRHGPQPEPYAELDAFATALLHPPCPLIIVTNEVGSGIVPGDRESRCFRDHAGWLNQRVALLASRVILVACGLPLALKGKPL